MAKQKSTDYKRAFNERAYDRLAITVPKGRKATVEAMARSNGESVNGFVNNLLMKAADMTEESWKRVDPGDMAEDEQNV